jgi:hypothetical protein
MIESMGRDYFRERVMRILRALFAGAWLAAAAGAAYADSTVEVFLNSS